jgi:glycosyltransferase involved in cell wall biosynthesis
MALRIGYVGQLAPHKGVHVLVAAARALGSRAFELTLNGPDRPHADYVQTLHRLAGDDPRIRFAGAYANEQVDEILAGIDALVVPSICHDNWPCVVLEAFRCGIPVVASRVGGLPEMVRDEKDGLLFEPGNAGELARCLGRLADEPLLLSRLRSEIRPVRSDREEQTELLEIYSSLAATGGTPD